MFVVVSKGRYGVDGYMNQDRTHLIDEEVVIGVLESPEPPF